MPCGRCEGRLSYSSSFSGPERRRRITSWPDQTIPSPTSASLQFRPITIDDQFREPLRPVFLFQLLFCQIVSELRRHLEFGDQQRDDVVRPDLLDEAVSRNVRVSRLRLPAGGVVLQERGQARVFEVLELLLGQRHRTIRVAVAAEANTATSCTANRPIPQPYRPGQPPLINQSRQIATVTRLSPNVPSSALPIVRYGWTTSSGTPPEYDW